MSLTVGGSPFVRLEDVRTGSAELPDVGYEKLADGSIDSDELFGLFEKPANRYRPMVRWWWNGDRVTGEEVLRELDVMQAAGIGGVEINPIRFPAEADPMKTTALTWMSDEWVKVLEVALRGTRERGMTCDMIVGSGWPYGGEFLSREDQTQMVALGTKNLTGPGRVRLARAELLESVSHNLVSSYKDSQKELFGLRLVPSQVGAVTAGVAVDDQLHKEFIELDLPAGEHVLYFLVKVTGFMGVINGAPGATGPVLNHYSGKAVERYLDRLSTRLTAKIGPLGEHFRAFFTDSIELEGANWCDDMFPEFRRRRGYDLSPWLPFVLFKVGEMGNAVSEQYGASFSPKFKAKTALVRYDFETTKHELFQERFVGTFVSWCTRHGVKSRMQAYGMDCDPITAGMMLDIPECETWIRSEKIEEFGSGDYRRGRSYTMINKFVSSAAHLAGKQLISCEEMTNTDDPFHASLERIKVAGDQSMLSGVTQSVLHGFNYSPPNAAFPGWVRYGTYFSERNTWWPYFKLWANYKARLSALFQNAVMQAEIAILPPMADIASQYGYQRDPFPKTVEPHYLYKLWEVVHQNGSGCDYLNEDVIQRSNVKQGRLAFGERSYKAILLVDVESIDPKTLKVLKDFVQSGGTLVFLDKTPNRAPGLLHNDAASLGIRSDVEQLRYRYPTHTPLVSVREEDMVGWYREIQKQYALAPAVLIDKPKDFVSQLYYRSGNRDIFFFSNYGPAEVHTFEATFALKGKTAWLWNAESGTRELYATAQSHNILNITLGPSESKLLVFEPSSSVIDATGSAIPLQRLSSSSLVSNVERVVSGPWTITFEHVNGRNITKVYQELPDFLQRDDLKSFAGTVVYRTSFRVESSDRSLVLDLGHLLHSVSQVEVNDHPMGTQWYGNQSYDITAAVIPGVNQLMIRVVTTLGNYMKTLTDNKAAQSWTENTPFYAMGLTMPVRLRTP
ncbi:glycosyl hydrolase [Granulicella arctica]|uniref:glycosyl hydrolase n=1 Tax=Granulicella arctica TaxID=940613 RepID=UPI0021DF4EEF|nr:glycosyl hydrolase [Granulicella arctica]